MPLWLKFKYLTNTLVIFTQIDRLKNITMGLIELYLAFWIEGVKVTSLFHTTLKSNLQKLKIKILKNKISRTPFIHSLTLMARHLPARSYEVILLYLCEWDRVKVSLTHMIFLIKKLGLFILDFWRPKLNLFS
jgi:hypothetical protein